METEELERNMNHPCRNNVNQRPLRFFLVALLLVSPIGCSRQPPTSTTEQTDGGRSSLATSQDVGLGTLLSRVWRVSNSPYGRDASAVYIFLPRGTVLETSCVETYRVATWTSDKTEPGKLTVFEDGRPAFTAVVIESKDRALKLRRTLAIGSKETQDVTLTAVDQEFVCPDLPK
jgi:hypothetical protein